MRLLLLNAAMSVGVALALVVYPPSGEPVAVFAFRGDLIAIVAKADGKIVAAGPAGSLIAVSDRADFTSQLYAAGADLVIAARGRVCNPAKRNS